MNLTDISEIKTLLGRYGFRFSKSLGQNFLVEGRIPEQIAESAGLDEGTGVLEIGPGIGCLTEKLAERAGKVVAVEMDNKLKPLLKETLAGHDNIEIVFGDIMKQKLPGLVREKLPGLRPVVCANLPYNITSPVLTAIVEAGCFETVTVMIQKEVAERICSVPGKASYGAFSLLIQWHCETEKLFDVPPSCFIPQPKVTSSVIRLTRRKQPPCSVDDEAEMFAVIRAAFNQRRKTFVNAVGAGIPSIGKELAAEALVNCGYDVNIRGEVLDIGGFATITNEILRIKNGNLS